MIWDVHPGSRIRILIFYPSRIPDPGVKGHRIPDPQHYQNIYFFQCFGSGSAWIRIKFGSSETGIYSKRPVCLRIILVVPKCICSRKHACNLVTGYFHRVGPTTSQSYHVFFSVKSTCQSMFIARKTPKTVLRIHEISVWILIRESIPGSRSGSCYFRQ
jgi:hypothetical protein